MSQKNLDPKDTSNLAVLSSIAANISLIAGLILSAIK